MVEGSLLHELLQLYENIGPLRVSFEDLSGIARDVPALRLPVAFQMHDCAFCLHAKSVPVAGPDCAFNKFSINRLVLRRMRGMTGQCHLGLTDIVEPVIFRHRVLGAFYYGSVVVSGTEARAEERIRRYCKRRGAPPEPYLRELALVPRITREDLRTAQQRIHYAARLVCALLESWGLPEERYRAEVYGTLWSYKGPVKKLPPLLKSAVRHVQLNYAEPLTVASVATALGCHPDYLSRTFKSVIGCTLGGYVQRVRVDHARQMLEGDRFSVSEIGYLVGFQEKSHFGRVFRTLIGQSPGEYRRQCASPGRAG